MIRVLHCADLHLSADPADRDYSLAVLDEIAGLAKKRGAAYLLFAGDTFNTFGDAETLRAEFRDRMEPLRGTCEVFLLAGNHEDLGRSKRKLANFDLGLAPENCIEFDGAPFRLIRRGGVEIQLIPGSRIGQRIAKRSVRRVFMNGLRNGAANPGRGPARAGDPGSKKGYHGRLRCGRLDPRLLGRRARSVPRRVARFRFRVAQKTIPSPPLRSAPR